MPSWLNRPTVNRYGNNRQKVEPWDCTVVTKDMHRISHSTICIHFNKGQNVERSPRSFRARLCWLSWIMVFRSQFKRLMDWFNFLSCTWLVIAISSNILLFFHLNHFKSVFQCMLRLWSRWYYLLQHILSYNNFVYHECASSEISVNGWNNQTKRLTHPVNSRSQQTKFLVFFYTFNTGRCNELCLS